MKLSLTTATLGLVAAPGALAWGGLGHITSAYIASQFVSSSTEAFLQDLLQNPTPDYLARVATWADTIRYTRWGRFTKNFHFIDAHDDPPYDCNVDYARDCKADGCVISALANYTAQSLDPGLPEWQRAQAAKFVVHFVSDLHQPLHNEDAAKGGNGIYVRWDGKGYNLHHVWDSSIAEKWLGNPRGNTYTIAEKWANQLVVEITNGKFAEEKEVWLKDMEVDNATSTAMAWSIEGNKLVCSHVFPEGPRAIAGQELGGEYFQKAGPVIEKQIARAGYRMAAWLDGIVLQYQAELAGETLSEEL